MKIIYNNENDLHILHKLIIPFGVLLLIIGIIVLIILRFSDPDPLSTSTFITLLVILTIAVIALYLNFNTFFIITDEYITLHYNYITKFWKKNKKIKYSDIYKVEQYHGLLNIYTSKDKRVATYKFLKTKSQDEAEDFVFKYISDKVGSDCIVMNEEETAKEIIKGMRRGKVKRKKKNR